MKSIVHLLFNLLSAAIIVCFLIVIVWFCAAMIVNFYKIYIKKKAKKCLHPDMTYNESPYNFWKCGSCGATFND
jgi:Na+/phosphate symporter